MTLEQDFDRILQDLEIDISILKHRLKDLEARKRIIEMEKKVLCNTQKNP